MAQFWIAGYDAHMRLPDGKILNLNTQESADLILGLYEYIEELESRTKRKSRRTKKQIDQETEELGG